MTESTISQIVTGVVTLGVAFIGYLKLKAGQAAQKTKLDTVDTKVDSYHKEVDGMKTELVNEVRAGALSKGKEIGVQQQKEESKDVAQQVVDAVKADPNIDITKTK